MVTTETLLEFDLPITWFLDNDQAGQDALYGRKDPETGKYLSQGILSRIGAEVPQMVVRYPRRLAGADAGDLAYHSIRRLVAGAEIWTYV